MLNNRKLLAVLLSLFIIVSQAGFASGASDTTTVWQGKGSSMSIEDVIGESLVGGLYSFGWSIDTDGDTVVVGYPNYQDETGEAFILKYNSDGSWTRLAKLSISEPVISKGRFGWDVAIDGDTVVVTGVGHAPFLGAAYIFTKPTGGWADLSTDDAKMLTVDGGARSTGFGHSVDIQNDTIVVGAPNALGSTGAVYVHKKPTGGWESGSSSNAILPGVVSGAWSGYSVALNSTGNVVVMGSADGFSNEVLVYTSASGDWSSPSGPARLLPSGIVSNAVLGMSVAISDNGETVVVGARNDQHSIECIGGWGPGSAYVFQSTGAAWPSGFVRPVARLTAANLNPNFDSSKGQTMPRDCTDVFGESVAIEGNLILVGAPWKAEPWHDRGEVFVYAKPSGGWADATENIRLLDASQNESSPPPMMYGQAVTFFNGYAFSISAYSRNGAAGFSPFSTTAPLASFVGTTSLASDGSGQVTANVSVLDLQNDSVNLKVEYSTDGIVWRNATLLEATDSAGSLTVASAEWGSGVSNIQNTQTEHIVNLIWNSAANVGGNTDVYLRVTPVGGEEVISKKITVSNPEILGEPPKETTPPTAILTGAPSGDTTSTSAIISVSSNDGAVAYRYSLDGGAYGGEAPIATPIVLNDLAVGQHTIRVITQNEEGNWQSELSPTVISWTVVAAVVQQAPVISGGGGGGGCYGCGISPTTIAPKVLGIKTQKYKDGTLLRIKGKVAKGKGRYYVIMKGGFRRAISNKELLQILRDYRRKYHKRQSIISLSWKRIQTIPLYKKPAAK